MLLGPAEFAAQLATLGPFEARPALAVAVSGGADSLALTLLAADWAAERGGSVTALTVDHGLRPGAADEARQVGRWLAARAIPHVILTAERRLPASGVAAAARRLRYRLLLAWCRSAGVLHLLLGHHRSDQAETVLLRWLRGSGAAGLAGISAVVELPAARLLRPLLNVPPERMRDFLRRQRQPWIEDPSNEDPAFARNRLRRVIPELAAGGISTEGLCTLARHGAMVRETGEAAAIALLAEACSVHPAGAAVLDRNALLAAPRWQAAEALARLVTTVGGRTWPPARSKVERMLTMVLEDAVRVSATLAGCRLEVDGERVRVFRELRGLPPPRSIARDEAVHWDRRFAFRFATARGYKKNFILQSVMDATSHKTKENHLILRERLTFPASVRSSLPVVCVDGAIAVLPIFGQSRRGSDPDSEVTIDVRFQPRRSLAGHGNFLA